ncbi:lytic transglycosylase domain-containing protein [Magnetospirillum molischianum]|uniref:Transglycosylase SLT domain-containing protein n=1 Tax=Magnetospirillum molischianum DSM 120 TaxID=1150626 RepID=H8FP75_MAGML|nr:lytic transglycosylase domain-containing protein [Magnetospirillum molischianum]CCG40163.1 hypothetical protein PHAMO_180132 [Magnetospirillum molischianum DSM 120]
MARVPTYTQPTVEARPLGAPQLSASVPAGAFDTGGSSLVEGGQKLAAMGDQLAAHAVRMAEEDAKTSALEALTAFQTSKRNVLYRNQDAFTSLEGQAAYAAYQHLPGALEEDRVRMGSNLGAAARKLYDQASIRDLSGDLDTAARHAATERKKWREQIVLTNVNSNIEQAATNWGDPAKRQASWNAARDVVLDWAAEMRIPYDSPIVQTRLKKVDTDYVTAVVNQGATSDPMGAKTFFDEHRKYVSSESIPALSGMIDQKTKKFLVDQDADRILAITAPANGLDAITAAIHAQESGGRATSPTSIDGARGGMQIMPATFARYAQPGESIDNPTDNMAVGKRIVADLSAKTGGDPARIAVGYFSGEDNIAPPGSPNPWKKDRTDGNGKSVSSYVRDVLGHVNDPRSSRLSAQFEALKDVPVERRDEVRAHLLRADQDAERVRTAQVREAEDFASDWVLTKRLDPLALPTKVQERLGPTGVKGWVEYAASMNKRVDDPVEYDRLVTMAALDPDRFVREDPTKWNLSPASTKELIGKKGTILSGDAREAEKTANLKRFLSLSRDLLGAAGIERDTDRMNNYTALGAQRLEQFREENKKRPADNDMLAIAKDLLMPGRLRGTGWVFEDKGVLTDSNAYVPFSEIPPQDRIQVVGWISAKGKAADNTTVESLYAAWKRGDRAAADAILSGATKSAPAAAPSSPSVVSKAAAAPAPASLSGPVVPAAASHQVKDKRTGHNDRRADPLDDAVVAGARHAAAYASDLWAGKTTIGGMYLRKPREEK